MLRSYILFSGLALAIVAQLAIAKNKVVKTASVTTNSTKAIIFTAPPREQPSVGRAKYEPIAQYLSKVLKRNVVYKHPGTWGVYRTKMLRGDYDIIFDGPHFNSYRAEKLNHNILAKVPIKHEFVVIVNKKNGRYKKMDQLAGRTFCAHAPPNLGTLTLLSQFPNPSRQPSIINTKGWDKIYKGVVDGKCTAGILPLANLRKLDRNGRQMKIVFRHHAMPNQAFSAGPRLNSHEQRKIAHALISREATIPTAKLREAYGVGKQFKPANNKEYAGISNYLKNEWGYY